MDEILKQYAPVSENNSRSIIRSKLGRMNKFPSEKMAQDVERIVDNVSIDFADSDYGEGPKH